MSLIKEYFELTKGFQDEYGKNTILLMQVGAFFEVYGINNIEKSQSNCITVDVENEFEFIE